MNSNIDESLKPHMDKNVLGLLSCETCQTGEEKALAGVFTKWSPLTWRVESIYRYDDRKVEGG